MKVKYINETLEDKVARRLNKEKLERKLALTAEEKAAGHRAKRARRLQKLEQGLFEARKKK